MKYVDAWRQFMQVRRLTDEVWLLTAEVRMLTTEVWLLTDEVMSPMQELAYYFRTAMPYNFY